MVVSRGEVPKLMLAVIALVAAPPCRKNLTEPPASDLTTRVSQGPR